MPFVAAFISAIFWAIAMVADTVWMKDIYEGNPRLPLVVSCVIGSFIAIPVLLIAMHWVPYHSPPGMAAFFALLAGCLAMLQTYLTYVLLNSPAKDSSEIAAYVAAAPLLVLASVWALHFFGFSEMGLELSRPQVFGVIAATAGFILLAFLTEGGQAVAGRYRLLLVLLLVLTAAYYIVLDQALALSKENIVDQGLDRPDITAFVSINPWFWAGFACGSLALLSRNTRLTLIAKSPQIIKRCWPIVCLELVATVAFGAEIFGLAGGHPALIGVVAEMHIPIIFIMGLLLVRWGWATRDHFRDVRKPIWHGLALSLIVLGLPLALTS